MDGFTVGGYAGTNVQFGNWVLGIDSSVSFVDITGEEDHREDASFFVDSELNWLTTTRGRVGYAFDNFMIFAAGGVAFAGAESSVDFGVRRLVAEGEEILFGWTAGAGIEAKFAENWSARVEYLFIRLEEDEFQHTMPAAALVSTPTLTSTSTSFAAVSPTTSDLPIRAI